MHDFGRGSAAHIHDGDLHVQRVSRPHAGSTMHRNPYIVAGLRRAGFQGGWLAQAP
ncbi:MAG TPA: hypothetical protein VEU55_00815 [Gemmatimonadales bacterium]|nr:hypothetical protein [Gemmatimonadales bacterium]